jgi:hypothetical protein
MAGAAITAVVMRAPNGARAATRASRAVAPIPLVVIVPHATDALLRSPPDRMEMRIGWDAPPA